MYHFCNRILSFFCKYILKNCSNEFCLYCTIFRPTYMYWKQRRYLCSNLIIFGFFYLHLLFFIHNKLIVYLLFIVGLKTIMFISYSSSKVLKLISIDHYKKSFPVNWALGEILEKRVMKKTGWLC